MQGYLQGLADRCVWGFTKVQTEAEVRECYGMYGDFALMVETDGYTSFSDNWMDPTITRVFGDSMPQAEGRVMAELPADGR